MSAEKLKIISRHNDTGSSLLGWTASVAVCPDLHNLPLINGLAKDGKVNLFRQSHGGLAKLLAEGKIDTALLGAIDLQREDLKPLVLPSGCISCEGPTHTAIIYSRVAPATVRRLHVDENCQTASAIAGIIWAETYERKLQVLPKPQIMPKKSIDRPQAIILQGDRVNQPPGDDYAWKIDLGQIWQNLTGLPLVFAVWTMQPDSRISPTLQARRAKIITNILDKARTSGLTELENIISDYAGRFGWPVELARKYLIDQMQYKFTSRHRRGLEMFFHLARKHGYIRKIRPMAYGD